jgi:hypothetical protein
MAGAASFRWILQLHKDVPKAARFYSEGLDFTVNVCTLRWAELQSGSLKLALMQSHKYEPFLMCSASNVFLSIFFLIYFALSLFDEMSTRSTHALISLLNMSLVLKISPIGFYWNIDNLISSHQSVCERHWNLPSDYVQTREGTFLY